MKNRLILGVGPAALALAGLVTVSAQAEDAPRARVGEQAPDFTLQDLEGNEHSLSRYTAEGKVVVLEWFNADCPYIKKHHKNATTMKDLHAKYEGRDVVLLAINSNAPGKQGAGKARNQRAKEEYGIPYPILLDTEDQQVSHLYGARTTPHMFVIDAEGVLRYSGAIDNNRDARELGDVNYIDQALEAILAGDEVATPQTRPYG